ncbi:DUF5954 family protein [Streptomyces sp. NPDC051907]|uniref:DUF5954 family protein n=1 Tax=Streptomyces sp. NPDC051907 TaxID=3155284 RepID=UPI003417C660
MSDFNEFNDFSEVFPAYRTIRVMPQQGLIAAFADEEAWRARKNYPRLMTAGLPVFFYTKELEQGGWEILGTGGDTPQSARDGLAAYLRRNAEGRRKMLAAAEKLDWVAMDEVRVAGQRYRVVRAEQFVRMGPDGPEPPRPSDPDPARPGEAYRVPSRVHGFVVDPHTESGVSEGFLRLDLMRSATHAKAVPAAVHADSVRARDTHPGVVVLPAEFGIAEKCEGRWRPHGGSSTTPQGARDGLAMHFRVFAPVMLKLDEEERAEYARAADRLDEKRGVGLSVAGTGYRVVRVETAVRVGPDGPERPRPSDHDPEPPVGPHIKQLKADGLLKEGELDDDDLSEDALELRRLMEKEQRRTGRL